MRQPSQKHYQIIKSKYVTEKAFVLENLHTSESNPSLKRCENPKFVFLVDKNANKREIAEAVEAIYADKNVKVVAVNTINVKPKKRRVRGRLGNRPGFKKAIVTFEKGDTIENV